MAGAATVRLPYGTRTAYGAQAATRETSKGFKRVCRVFSALLILATGLMLFSGILFSDFLFGKAGRDAVNRFTNGVAETLTGVEADQTYANVEDNVASADDIHHWTPTNSGATPKIFKINGDDRGNDAYTATAGSTSNAVAAGKLAASVTGTQYGLMIKDSNGTAAKNESPWYTLSNYLPGYHTFSDESNKDSDPQIVDPWTGGNYSGKKNPHSGRWDYTGAAGVDPASASITYRAITGGSSYRMDWEMDEIGYMSAYFFEIQDPQLAALCAAGVLQIQFEADVEALPVADTTRGKVKHDRTYKNIVFYSSAPTVNNTNSGAGPIWEQLQAAMQIGTNGSYVRKNSAWQTVPTGNYWVGIFVGWGAWGANDKNTYYNWCLEAQGAADTSAEPASAAKTVGNLRLKFGVNNTDNNGPTITNPTLPTDWMSYGDKSYTYNFGTTNGTPYANAYDTSTTNAVAATAITGNFTRSTATSRTVTVPAPDTDGYKMTEKYFRMSVYDTYGNYATSSLGLIADYKMDVITPVIYDVRTFDGGSAYEVPNGSYTIKPLKPVLRMRSTNEAGVYVYMRNTTVSGTEKGVITTGLPTLLPALQTSITNGGWKLVYISSGKVTGCAADGSGGTLLELPEQKVYGIYEFCVVSKAKNSSSQCDKYSSISSPRQLTISVDAETIDFSAGLQKKVGTVFQDIGTSLLTSSTNWFTEDVYLVLKLNSIHYSAVRISWTGTDGNVLQFGPNVSGTTSTTAGFTLPDFLNRNASSVYKGTATTWSPGNNATGDFAFIALPITANRYPVTFTVETNTTGDTHNKTTQTIQLFVDKTAPNPVNLNAVPANTQYTTDGKWVTSGDWSATYTFAPNSYDTAVRDNTLARGSVSLTYVTYDLTSYTGLVGLNEPNALTKLRSVGSASFTAYSKNAENSLTYTAFQTSFDSGGGGLSYGTIVAGMYGGGLTNNAGARMVELWVTDQAGLLSTKTYLFVLWDGADYKVSSVIEGRTEFRDRVTLSVKNGTTEILPTATFKRGDILTVAAEIKGTYKGSYVLGYLKETQNYAGQNAIVRYGYDGRYFAGFSLATLYKYGTSDFWTDESYPLKVGPADVNALRPFGGDTATQRSIVVSTSARARLNIVRMDTGAVGTFTEHVYNGQAQGAYYTLSTADGSGVSAWTGSGGLTDWTGKTLSEILIADYYLTDSNGVYSNPAPGTTTASTVAYTGELLLYVAKSGIVNVGTYYLSVQIVSEDYISTESRATFTIAQRALTVTPTIRNGTTGDNTKIYGNYGIADNSPSLRLWNSSTRKFILYGQAGFTSQFADTEITYTYVIAAYTLSIPYNGTNAPIFFEPAIDSSLGEAYLQDGNGADIKPYTAAGIVSGLSRESAGENSEGYKVKVSNGLIDGYRITHGNLAFGEHDYDILIDTAKYPANSTGLTEALKNTNFGYEIAGADNVYTRYIINKRTITIDIDESRFGGLTGVAKVYANATGIPVIASTDDKGQTLFSVTGGSLAKFGNGGSADKLFFDLKPSGNLVGQYLQAGIYAVGVEYKSDYGGENSAHDNYNITNIEQKAVGQLPEAAGMFYIVYPRQVGVSINPGQNKEFGANDNAIAYTVDNGVSLNDKARIERAAGQDVGTYEYSNMYAMYASQYYEVARTSPLVTLGLPIIYAEVAGKFVDYDKDLHASTTIKLYTFYREIKLNGTDAEKAEGAKLIAATKYFYEQAAMYLSLTGSYLYFINNSKQLEIFDPTKELSAQTQYTDTLIYLCPNNATSQNPANVTGMATSPTKYTFEILPLELRSSVLYDQGKTFGENDTTIVWSYGATPPATPTYNYNHINTGLSGWVPAPFTLSLAPGSVLTRAMKVPTGKGFTMTVGSKTYQYKGPEETGGDGDWVTYEAVKTWYSQDPAAAARKAFIMLFENADENGYYIMPAINDGYTVAEPTISGGVKYYYMYAQYALNGSITSQPESYFGLLGLDDRTTQNRLNTFKLTFQDPTLESSAKYVVNKKEIVLSVTPGQSYIYGEVNGTQLPIIAHQMAGVVNNSSISGSGLAIEDVAYRILTANVADSALRAAWADYNNQGSLSYRNQTLIKDYFANGFVGLYLLSGGNYVPWNGAATIENVYVGALSATLFTSGDKLLLNEKNGLNFAEQNFDASDAYHAYPGSYVVNQNYRITYDVTTTFTIYKRKVYLYAFDKNFAGDRLSAINANNPAVNRIIKVYDGTSNFYQYRNPENTSGTYEFYVDWANVLNHANSGIVGYTSGWATYTAVGGSGYAFTNTGITNATTGTVFYLDASYTGDAIRKYNINTSTNGVAFSVNNNYEFAFPETLTLQIDRKEIDVDGLNENGVYTAKPFIGTLPAKVYDGTVDRFDDILSLTDWVKDYLLVDANTSIFATQGVLFADRTAVKFDVVSAYFASPNVNSLANGDEGYVNLIITFSISATQTDTKHLNYTVRNYTYATATITRKDVAISFPALTKVQYSDVVDIPVGYSGFVAGFTAAQAPLKFVPAGAATPALVGTYPIEIQAKTGTLLTHVYADGEYVVAGNYRYSIANANATVTTTDGVDGAIEVTKKTVAFEITNSEYPTLPPISAVFQDEATLVSNLLVAIRPIPDPHTSGIHNPGVLDASYAYNVKYYVVSILKDGGSSSSAEEILAGGNSSAGVYSITFAMYGSDDKYEGQTTLYFSVGRYLKVNVTLARPTVVFNGSIVNLNELLVFTEDGTGTVINVAGWSFTGVFNKGSEQGIISSATGNGPLNAGTYTITVSAINPNAYNTYDGIYSNLPNGSITILPADTVVTPINDAGTPLGVDNVAQFSVYGDSEKAIRYTVMAFYPADLSGDTNYNGTDLYVKSASGKYYRAVKVGGTVQPVDSSVFAGATADAAAAEAEFRVYKLSALRKGTNASETPGNRITGQLSRENAAVKNAGTYAITTGSLAFLGDSEAYINHNLSVASINSEIIYGEDTVLYEITKRTLHFSIVAGTKTYDGEANFSVDLDVTNFAEGEGYADTVANTVGSVPLTFWLRVYTPTGGYYDIALGKEYNRESGKVDAGTYDVIFGTITLLSGNYDYDVTDGLGAFTVQQKTVAVTPTKSEFTKIYGDADPSYTYSAGAFTYNVNDLAVIDRAKPIVGTLVRINAGTQNGEIVIGTTNFITVRYADGVTLMQDSLYISSNYRVVLAFTPVLKILPATLTISVPSVTRLYYENNPSITPTVTGFRTRPGTIVPDQISDFGTDAQRGFIVSFINRRDSAKPVTFETNVGYYADAISAVFTLNGTPMATIGNYKFESLSAGITINPVTITLTPVAGVFQKTYGVSDMTLRPTGTASDSLLAFYSTTMNGRMPVALNTLDSRFTISYTPGWQRNVTVTIETLQLEVRITGALGRPASESVGEYIMSQGSAELIFAKGNQNFTLMFPTDESKMTFTINPKAVKIVIDDSEAGTLSKVYGDPAPALRGTGIGWVENATLESPAYNGLIYINDTDDACINKNFGKYAYDDGIELDNRYAIPTTSTPYPIVIVDEFRGSSNYVFATVLETRTGILNPGMKVNKRPLVISENSTIAELNTFYADGKIYDGTTVVILADTGVRNSTLNFARQSDTVTLLYKARYDSANAGIRNVVFYDIKIDANVGAGSNYILMTEPQAGHYEELLSTAEFVARFNLNGDPIVISKYTIGFNRDGVILETRQYDGTTNANVASYINPVSGLLNYSIGIPALIMDLIAANAGDARYGINIIAKYNSKNAGTGEAVIDVEILIPNASLNMVFSDLISSMSGEIFVVSQNSITMRIRGVQGEITKRELYLSVFNAISKEYDNTSTARINYSLDNIVRYIIEGAPDLYDIVTLSFIGNFTNITDGTKTTQVGYHTVTLEALAGNNALISLGGADSGNYVLKLTEYRYTLYAGIKANPDDDYNVWEEEFNTEELTAEEADAFFAPTPATDEDIAALENIFVLSGGILSKVTTTNSEDLYSTSAANRIDLTSGNIYVLISGAYVLYDEATHGTVEPTSIDGNLVTTGGHMLFYRVRQGDYYRLTDAQAYALFATLIYNGTSYARITRLAEATSYFTALRYATDAQIAAGVNLYVRIIDGLNTTYAKYDGLKPGHAAAQKYYIDFRVRKNIYVWTDFSINEDYTTSTDVPDISDNAKYIYVAGRYVPYFYEVYGTNRYGSADYYKANKPYYRQANTTDLIQGINLWYEKTAGTTYIPYEPALHTTAFADGKLYVQETPSVYYRLATLEEVTANGSDLYIKGALLRAVTTDSAEYKYGIAASSTPFGNGTIGKFINLFTAKPDVVDFNDITDFESWDGFPDARTVYTADRENYIPYDQAVHGGQTVYVRVTRLYAVMEEALSMPVHANMEAEIYSHPLTASASAEDKEYDGNRNGTVRSDSDRIINIGNVEGKGYNDFIVDINAIKVTFDTKDVALNAIMNVDSKPVELSNIKLYTYVANIASYLVSGYVNYAKASFLYVLANPTQIFAGSGLYAWFGQEGFYARADAYKINKLTESGEDMYLYDGTGFVLRAPGIPVVGETYVDTNGVEHIAVPEIYYKVTDTFAPHDGDITGQFTTKTLYYRYDDYYAPYEYTEATNTYELLLPDLNVYPMNAAEFEAVFGLNTYRLVRRNGAKSHSDVDNFTGALSGTEVLLTYGGDILNYAVNETATVRAIIRQKEVSIDSANAQALDKLYDNSYAGQIAFKAVNAQAEGYLNELFELLGLTTSSSYSDYASAVVLNASKVLDFTNNLYTIVKFETVPLAGRLLELSSVEYDDLINYMTVAQSGILGYLTTLVDGVLLSEIDTILLGVILGDDVTAKYTAEFDTKNAKNGIRVVIRISSLTGAQKDNYIPDARQTASVYGNILPIELDIVSAAVKDKTYDGTYLTQSDGIVLSGLRPEDASRIVARVSPDGRAVLIDPSTRAIVNGVEEYDTATNYGTAYGAVFEGIILEGTGNGNYVFRLVPGYVWSVAGVIYAYAVNGGVYADNFTINKREITVQAYASNKDYDGTVNINKNNYGYTLSGYITADEGKIALDYSRVEVLSGITIPDVFFLSPDTDAATHGGVGFTFVNHVYKLIPVASMESAISGATYYRREANGRLVLADYTTGAAGTFFRIDSSDAGIDQNYKIKVNAGADADGLYTVSANASILPVRVTAAAPKPEDVYGSFDINKIRDITYTTEKEMTYIDLVYNNKTFRMTAAYAESIGVPTAVINALPKIKESFTPAGPNEVLPKGFAVPSVTLQGSEGNETPVGTYNIYISQGAAQNYEFSYRGGTYTVNKKELYLQVDDYSRVFGEINPAVSINYIGWVGTQNENNLLDAFVAPHVIFDAILSSNIGGGYGIYLSGGYARNYVMIWLAPGGAKVEIKEDRVRVASLEITSAVFAVGGGTGLRFESFTTVYDGSVKALYVSNMPANSTATYYRLNQDGTVNGSGTTVFPTIRDAGVYRFKAVVENPNYASYEMTATLTINKAVPYIAANSVTKTYTGKPISGLATVYPYSLSVNYIYYLRNEADLYIPIAATDVVNAGTYYYEAYYSAPDNGNYLTVTTSRMIIRINPIEVTANVTQRTYVEGHGNGIVYTVAGGLDQYAKTYVVYTNRSTGDTLAAGVIPTAAGAYDFKILAQNTNYLVKEGTGILVIGHESVASDDGEANVTANADKNTIIDYSAEITVKTILEGVLDDDDADNADIARWRAVVSALGSGNKMLAYIETSYTVISSSGVRQQEKLSGTVQVRLALPDGVKAGDKVQLVKVNDDGSYSTVRVSYENGYAVFTTDELGNYAFITTETPMWVWLAVGGGALLLVLIGVVLAILFNRRAKMAYDEQVLSENSSLLDEE